VPVRQRDVAKLTGVSPRTVSNVVSGYAHVSAEVREKVQAAINELGYRRSDAARGLRLGRTGVIALAVPSLRERYFADLAEAVVFEAEQHGLTVMIELTGGTRDRERLVLNGGRSSLTDGALMSALSLRTADVKLAAGPAYPLVLLGDRELRGPFDHVAIPNEAGTYAAVRHLLDLGRRRIALLGTADSTTGSLRLKGFRRALKEAGLDPALHLQAPWTRAGGESAITALLASDGQLPDALFAMNDTLALGALTALATHNIAVPADVAVIGFDNIDESRHSTPPLSSIAPSVEELASTGITLLTSRLADPARPPERVASQFQLIKRRSG
jgi:DNA-binding LacI/PurR family transcriptional regulator